MAAATLRQAAEQCYSHMFVYWTAGTLDARFAAFNTDIVAIFPSDGGDNTVDQRTVSNWIVIGRNIEDAIPLTTASEFNSAAEYVYHLMWAADAADPPVNRISAAQAAAILAAYNAHLD